MASKGMPFSFLFLLSFFELGNELIIVYQASVILDPSNGAKT